MCTIFDLQSIRINVPLWDTVGLNSNVGSEAVIIEREELVSNLWCFGSPLEVLVQANTFKLVNLD